MLNLLFNDLSVCGKYLFNCLLCPTLIHFLSHETNWLWFLTHMDLFISPALSSSHTVFTLQPESAAQHVTLFPICWTLQCSQLCLMTGGLLTPLCGFPFTKDATALNNTFRHQWKSSSPTNCSYLHNSLLISLPILQQALLNLCSNFFVFFMWQGNNNASK